MDIGSKLSELRKKKGLSQEEVAYKLNVSRQTVSKWELGQSTPDFDKIKPLCDLYDISADELLTGKVKENVEGSLTEEKEFDKKNHYKRALGISLGVFLYFIAVISIMITIPVLRMNPIVGSAIFLFIAGIATFIIIYVSIVYKGTNKNEIESKKNTLEKQIDEVLSLIFCIIYLLISFITMAWHITWIIWVIYALITEIIKLVFMLRGEDNEK